MRGRIGADGSTVLAIEDPTMKLIDTHLVLLSKAAQHEDKLLTRPDKVSDKAAQSLVTKLRRAGLVEELRVSRDQPHWRMDDENGPVGLRITQAGLIALGLDPEESATPKQPRSHTSRPGTKQALILELLSREGGRASMI
jgi:hypothetical protein